MKDKKKIAIACTAMGALALGIACPIIITNAQESNQKIEQKSDLKQQSKIDEVKEIEESKKEEVKSDVEQIKKEEVKTQEGKIKINEEDKVKKLELENKAQEAKDLDQRREEEQRVQEEAKKAEERRIQDETKKVEEVRVQQENQARVNEERKSIEKRAEFVDYSWDEAFLDGKVYRFKAAPGCNISDFSWWLDESDIPASQRISIEEARQIAINTDYNGIKFDASQVYACVPSAFGNEYQILVYDNNYKWTGYIISVRHDGKHIMLHNPDGETIYNVYR